MKCLKKYLILSLLAFHLITGNILNCSNANENFNDYEIEYVEEDYSHDREDDYDFKDKKKSNANENFNDYEIEYVEEDYSHNGEDDYNFKDKKKLNNKQKKTKNIERKKRAKKTKKNKQLKREKKKRKNKEKTNNQKEKKRNNNKKRNEDSFKNLEQSNNENESKEIIEKKNKKNKLSGFLSTYINRDKNPIFEDKTHMVGVMTTHDLRGLGKPSEMNLSLYNFDKLTFKERNRRLRTVAVQYSRANKLFGINGRYSIGFFSMYGEDYYQYTRGNILTFGIEGIQELIIGHPMLYMTLGIGISYMFGKNGLPSGYEGLTCFNFVPMASIGHRFNNGVIFEIIYKHYSNGNDYMGRNKAVDSIGLAIRYAF